VEQRFLRAEMEASAHDALCELGAQDRRILEWHIWDGLSHAEVGRRLRISEEAARQRYSRALRALREKFRERCR
jgi:RNA polymerase sigma factor (sigma-70 family)